MALHDSEHYDEKRGNFRHYAVLKTKIAVRSDLRGRSRHNQAIAALKMAIPEPMEGDGVSPYLTRQEALTVFSMLNDDHRAALSMLESGYTVEEIAEIMNRNSGNTIYGIIRRAQKKGRELLAELNTPRPPLRSRKSKQSRPIRGDPNKLEPERSKSHDHKRRAP